MGLCGQCGRYDMPYPGHELCECVQSVAPLVKANRELLKMRADIATLDRATDQTAARRMVKRAVFRRLNETRGELITRFGNTDTCVPMLDELQRACLRVTRLAYGTPKLPDAAELNKVRESMRAAAERTMYLVVVCDTRDEEARAQTVGLFDTQKEADDYAADLNGEAFTPTQHDRAFVQPWLVGDMRL